MMILTDSDVVAALTLERNDGSWLVYHHVLSTKV